MKPLTLEETKLKSEMKNNCLKGGKYKDEKAKDKFKMLCHLEDFEVQYWELDEENKRLRKTIIHNEKCRRKMQQSLIKQIDDLELQCKKQKEVIDRKKYLLKEQGTELKELYSEIDKLQGRIDKAIEYLEEPNRDSFDYSKAILLDILKEVSE